MNLSSLTRWLPFLAWPRPDRQLLKGEFWAGMTVGLLLVPQGVAYAALAGMPLVTGIYASLIPALVAVLFSSSTRLGVGPTALTSLLIGAALTGLAEPGSAQWVALAAWMALFSGLLQLVMGLARFGWLLNLITSPVLSGFTQAAALLILGSQLRSLTGLRATDWGAGFWDWYRGGGGGWRIELGLGLCRRRWRCGGRIAFGSARPVLAGRSALVQFLGPGDAGARGDAGEFSGDRLQCQGGEPTLGRAMGRKPGSDRPGAGQDQQRSVRQLCHQRFVFALGHQPVCRRQERLGHVVCHRAGAAGAAVADAGAIPCAAVRAGGRGGHGGDQPDPARSADEAVAGVACGGRDRRRDLCADAGHGTAHVLGRAGGPADESEPFSVPAAAPPHHRGGPASGWQHARSPSVAVAPARATAAGVAHGCRARFCLRQRVGAAGDRAPGCASAGAAPVPVGPVHQPPRRDRGGGLCAVAGAEAVGGRDAAPERPETAGRAGAAPGRTAGAVRGAGHVPHRRRGAAAVATTVAIATTRSRAWADGPGLSAAGWLCAV